MHKKRLTAVYHSAAHVNTAVRAVGLTFRTHPENENTQERPTGVEEKAAAFPRR